MHNGIVFQPLDSNEVSSHQADLNKSCRFIVTSNYNQVNKQQKRASP